MTRINCGIPPADLTDKHLIAEHREIKRVPNVVSKGKFNLDGQPKKFKLGIGHVKFFYDKLLFLQIRYEEIYLECKRRGFNVTYFGGAWKNVPNHLMNDYTPSIDDAKLVIERINQKNKRL